MFFSGEIVASEVAVILEKYHISVKFQKIMEKSKNHDFSKSSENMPQMIPQRFRTSCAIFFRYDFQKKYA